MTVGILQETVPRRAPSRARPRAASRRCARRASRSSSRPGPGAAPASRTRSTRPRGPRSSHPAAEVFAQADVPAQVRTPGANPATGRADAEALRSGQTVIGLADPLGTPEAAEAARRQRRDELRAGAHPAHHPRAEHGRAVVDGDHRRLQGGAAGRDRAAAHVPDDDDGGGHDRARRTRSSSAPASPACRPSRPPAGSAPRSRPTTCARR